MRMLLPCAVVALSAGSSLADAKANQAKEEVRAFTQGAEIYKIRHGKYPATLKELVDAKFVAPKFNNPTDPWGNPYQYDAKGTRNGGKKPDIWAVAPDKVLIGNWPDQKEKKDK